MKIIFRTSKRRPFFIGTNGPILNVQKTFIFRRVPTGMRLWSEMTLHPIMEKWSVVWSVTTYAARKNLRRLD